MLGANRYLTGEYLTEADVRLFTTMIRFDAVYHGHFKCNLRRIADYPNLSNWLRELYQWPGIAETVDFSNHYYGSHKTINPRGLCRRGQSRISVCPMTGSGWRQRGLAQGLIDLAC
jgi:putative glutathione S-transferase